MGDRTKIADALEQMAVEAEDGYSIPAGPSEVTTFRDAARVLRADPDTSDEHKPCPHCNDEGVVCTLDGEIIGPCDCTSDDLFTEARRLLDAYPEDVFESPPQDWKAGMVTGTVPDAVDEDGYLDVWITPDAFAAHVLRKIALPVIAALLAERDADVSAGAVARTVAMSHIAAERDAERAARERAEAEARQLRQAVMEAATELGLAHEPEWASPAAKEKGLNPVWCAICGAADGSWPCTSRMVLDDLLAVVAEGAEDRAKFPGLHDRPDTGKECHYLAVTMPHGGLFCNKCGWAEGAEDRGQTHTPDGSDG